MNILGLDPGGTTGWCALHISEDKTAMTILGYGEREFSDRLFLYVRKLIQQYSLDLVVAESVVTTGRMNGDKMTQIQAYTNGEIATRMEDLSFAVVSPEHRGTVKEVPKEVTGGHARDAYRAAVAWLRANGMYYG